MYCMPHGAWSMEHGAWRRFLAADRGGGDGDYQQFKPTECMTPVLALPEVDYMICYRDAVDSSALLQLHACDYHWGLD